MASRRRRRSARISPAVAFSQSHRAHTTQKGCTLRTHQPGGGFLLQHLSSVHDGLLAHCARKEALLHELVANEFPLGLAAVFPAPVHEPHRVHLVLLQCVVLGRRGALVDLRGAETGQRWAKGRVGATTHQLRQAAVRRTPQRLLRPVELLDDLGRLGAARSLLVCRVNVNLVLLAFTLIFVCVVILARASRLLLKERLLLLLLLLLRLAGSRGWNAGPWECVSQTPTTSRRNKQHPPQLGNAQHAAGPHCDKAWNRADSRAGGRTFPTFGDLLRRLAAEHGSHSCPQCPHRAPAPDGLCRAVTASHLRAAGRGSLRTGQLRRRQPGGRCSKAVHRLTARTP